MACCINCYFGFSCVLEHKVLFKSVAVVHISIKMCNHPRQNKRDSKKMKLLLAHTVQQAGDMSAFSL